MNAPEKWLLPDVQAIADRRNIYINHVGVKSLVHPVRIASADGGVVGGEKAEDTVLGIAGMHRSKGILRGRRAFAAEISDGAGNRRAGLIKCRGGPVPGRRVRIDGIAC